MTSRSARPTTPYLLENSEMFVWRSNLQTRQLTYSRSLRQSEYEETFDDYINRIFPDEKEDIVKAFKDPDTMSKAFNIIHHFRYTHYSKKPAWHAVSGIPTYDKEHQTHRSTTEAEERDGACRGLR